MFKLKRKAVWDTFLVGAPQSLLRLMYSHHCLRCSYKLHGSVMAPFVILIFFEFAVLRQVTYVAYTQRFVCLCLSSIRHDSVSVEGFVICYRKSRESFGICKATVNLFSNYIILPV